MAQRLRAGRLTSMPRWVFGRIAEALNHDAEPLEGSKVLVLGLAYKANVDDDRESPSYEIIEFLRHAGCPGRLP